jgi:hypothetical protein
MHKGHKEAKEVLLFVFFMNPFFLCGKFSNRFLRLFDRMQPLAILFCLLSVQCHRKDRLD